MQLLSSAFLPLSFSRHFLYIYLLSLFLLSPYPADARPGNLWDVDIDNGPAPSPADGPPLSANAIRDPAYLPVEVVCIFASYLVFILIVGTLLLTVGRRLRRSAQGSPRSLKMEIVNPDKAGQIVNVGSGKLSPVPSNVWDPSPISPTKKSFTSNIWPSPNPNPNPNKDANPWDRQGSFRKHSKKESMQSSVATFDESVIEEDRQRNEIEMDRLYAAVAEHEGQRSTGSLQIPQPPISPRHPPRQQGPPPSFPLAQHPPELQHLRGYPSHQLPPSPPPESVSSLSPSHQSATSPGGRRAFSRPSPIQIVKTTNVGSAAPSPSPAPRSSSRSSFAASIASLGKKRAASIRNLPISPPMGSPDIRPDIATVYSESEPFAPRNYPNPGPPPLPPNAGSPERRFGSISSARSARSNNRSDDLQPATLQSPRGMNFSIPQPPAIPEEQSRHPFALSVDPPQSDDGSVSSSTVENTADMTTPTVAIAPAPQSATKQRSKPSPLQLGTSSKSTGQSTLPLRTAPLPFRSLRSPTSQRPPSQIKNTEIVRPEPSRDRGLRAPGSAVPHTATMPQTPYSPFYMPQTPLTPMTPSRLVSRNERKRKEKEEGRRILTVDDVVEEEGDMWGDPYA